MYPLARSIMTKKDRRCHFEMQYKKQKRRGSNLAMFSDYVDDNLSL